VHVSATGLRTVTRGPLRTGFARLGGVAFTVVEVPPEGSAGTSLEESCTEAHWAVVLNGSVDVVRGDERHKLEAGSAFHIPAGQPEHRLFASGAVTMAGFVPLERAQIARRTVLEGTGTSAAGRIVGSEERTLPMVIRDDLSSQARDGRVEADSARMGPWVLCRARFGRTSGYVSSWCDAEHFGVVVAGDLAIEWEDDVEVLSAGDFYHCRSGPPGHRFEVADAASVVDFTPFSALRESRRLADWRRRATAVASIATGSSPGDAGSSSGVVGSGSAGLASASSAVLPS
jgi:mannose-6-phosphate isomerase-like protein (cupin superfamily)